MDIPQLTRGEAKVYTTLLKLNESSIGNILKFSGVSHSKIYDILKRLAGKGLVSTISRNGKQYFSAASPKVLQNLIEEQEKKLQTEKELLKQMMPRLLSEKNTQKTQNLLSAYEGINGIKHLLEEALAEVQKGEEILILGTPVKIVEYAGGYLKDWQKRRMEKGALCKIICDPNAPSWKEEWWKKSKAKKLTKSKVSTSISPAYLVITSKSVTTIYFANDILGFKISHQEIAERYRTFFEEFWKQK